MTYFPYLLIQIFISCFAFLKIVSKEKACIIWDVVHEPVIFIAFWMADRLKLVSDSLIDSPSVSTEAGSPATTLEHLRHLGNNESEAWNEKQESVAGPRVER